MVIVSLIEIGVLQKATTKIHWTSYCSLDYKLFKRNWYITDTVKTTNNYTWRQRMD